MNRRPNVLRRFLLWIFAAPESPWVTLNVSLDFTNAQAYLQAVEQKTSQRISIQALMVATIGRTLQAFPQANARIVGHTIHQQPHVGVAMPVNLLGHTAGNKRELSMIVVDRTEERTLADISSRIHQQAKGERQGKVSNPLLSWMIKLGENIPNRAFFAILDAADKAMRQPSIANRWYRQFPVTTLVSNPGAVFSQEAETIQGLRFRGGSFQLPHRLVQIGTMWGLSAVQDEVIAIAGKPQVRPMLPLVLLFDHRLIDGVLSSRMLLKINDIVQDPERFFGPEANS